MPTCPAFTVARCRYCWTEEGIALGHRIKK